MLQSQLEQQSKAVDTIVGNMKVLENKLAEVRRPPLVPMLRVHRQEPPLLLPAWLLPPPPPPPSPPLLLLLVSCCWPSLLLPLLPRCHGCRRRPRHVCEQFLPPLLCLCRRR